VDDEDEKVGVCPLRLEEGEMGEKKIKNAKTTAGVTGEWH